MKYNSYPEKVMQKQQKVMTKCHNFYLPTTRVSFSYNLGASGVKYRTTPGCDAPKSPCAPGLTNAAMLLGYAFTCIPLLCIRVHTQPSKGILLRLEFFLVTSAMIFLAPVSNPRSSRCRD